LNCWKHEERVLSQDLKDHFSVKSYSEKGNISGDQNHFIYDSTEKTPISVK